MLQPENFDLSSKIKGRVGFIGSCFAEQFVIHSFAEKYSYRAFRINTVSLVDQRKPDISFLEGSPANLVRHMRFEARKDFMERLHLANLDYLVLDFVRDVRCPLLEFEDGILSYPYELLDAPEEVKEKIVSRATVLRVGSKVYKEKMIASYIDLAKRLNDLGCDTKIILLDMLPTSNFTGREMNPREFALEYISWLYRVPMLSASCHFLESLLDQSYVYKSPSEMFSDDDSEYGPSPIHYSKKCWEKIALDFLALARSDGAIFRVRPLREMEGAFDALKPIEETIKDMNAVRYQGADILYDLSPFISTLYGNHAANYMTEKPHVSDAVSAFTWILGRLPESVNTILSHQAIATRNELRNRLLSSEEFQHDFRNRSA